MGERSAADQADRPGAKASRRWTSWSVLGHLHDQNSEMADVPLPAAPLGRARRRLSLRRPAEFQRFEQGRSPPAGKVRSARLGRSLARWPAELGAIRCTMAKQPANLGRDARALPAVLRRDPGRKWAIWGHVQWPCRNPSTIPARHWAVVKDNRFDTPR